MKTFTLVMTLTACAAMTMAAPPVSRDTKKPAQKKDKPPFAGVEANWLPKGVNNLPTGADIEKRAEKLTSRARAVDPFSVSTYPREEDVVVEDPNATARPTFRITLNQALQTLKLNGVNLRSKEFLIGGRNVYEGDVLELSFKNELFQALVVEVSASEIVFRDLQRGDVGIMPHNMIPKLQLEPMRNVASSLEPKWAPMEPATPLKK